MNPSRDRSRPTTGDEFPGPGWTLAFTATGSRLEEAADLYRELGYEVCLVPLAVVPLTSPIPECADCFAAQSCGAGGPVMAIYIRPKGGSPDESRDLPGEQSPPRD